MKIQKLGFQTWKTPKKKHKNIELFSKKIFLLIYYNNYWFYSFHEDVVNNQRKLVFIKVYGSGMAFRWSDTPNYNLH